jgi:ABC-type Fe3+/spermidine/putrescine transport system ATPase subunit
MVFQNAALFDSMTVGDNIALGLRHQGREKAAAIAQRVEECLGFVGLTGTAGLKPASLSGG